MKLIINADMDKLTQATWAAEEFIEKGYTSAVITTAGVSYHIYRTKTESVVVKQVKR